MPIIRRAWIAALIVCGLAGPAVLASGGDAAYATASIRHIPATAAPTPSPSQRPDTGAPATRPATTAPGDPAGTPASAPPPGTAPPPGAADGGAGSGCGWFDVACEFRQAVNGFFRGIVSDALNPVFRFLARSVLSTPRIDQTGRVHSLWTTSVWIADTCFVLLVVAGGILIMGHQSLQTSYTIKDVGPRLVIAIVAANVNLPLIGQAIELANALSRAFVGQGVDAAQAANTLKGLVLHEVTDATDAFTTILAMVAVVAGVVVLFTFASRTMMLVLLTVAAPLALACHALPQTDGLARLWWRALAGVLATQVAQALVFATALRVFFTSDQADLFGLRSGKGLFDLVLVICLLYILARIPAWVSRMIFRGGMGRSPLTRIIRTLAAMLIFRRLAARPRTGRAVTRIPPGPPPPPPPTLPVTPIVPPPPRHPNPPSWSQPQLPFPPAPPAPGTQLQLPVTPPQPGTPRSAAGTQLRLPGVAAVPPRWQQTTLPIRPRYTQTRLPAPPPRPHSQAELPLTFPPPGRSPRRLADTAALRDAETRTRRAAPNPSSRESGRNR